MSENYSSTSAPTGKTTSKPNKPYEDFPLFAHPNGSWAKKIRGKCHYFGPWHDPDGALKKYLEQKDALHAGRKPRPDTEGLNLKALCNQFLAHKQDLMDAGELAKRTWQDYKEAATLLMKHFGWKRLVEDIGPDDFADLRKAMAKKWGPVTLGNVIQRMRVIFKYAVDNGLVQKPVLYGQAFKRPSRKTIRIDRARKGPKLFTPKEILALLLFAPPHLEAMILLAINCGLGNADCGQLPISAVDLDNGWIDYPRPKTGIARKCALWPETIEAIREAIAQRPTPKDENHSGLVFITKYGLPWAKDTADQTLAKEFGKMLKSLHINGRKGLGFYTLRHTFRTVADESKDQAACDYIMGHEVPHMSSIYRETISNERLQAVADQVRKWLFAPVSASLQ